MLIPSKLFRFATKGSSKKMLRFSRSRPLRPRKYMQLIFLSILTLTRALKALDRRSIPGRSELSHVHEHHERVVHALAREAARRSRCSKPIISLQAEPSEEQQADVETQPPGLSRAERHTRRPYISRSSRCRVFSLQNALSLRTEPQPLVDPVPDCETQLVDLSKKPPPT